MEWLSKLREKRKVKREERQDLYDKIELKLKRKLNELEVGTEEYDRVQKELREINQIREESRESKRRISKKDKGGMLLKIVGGVTGLVGVGSLIWAEREGMTFTGEKRNIIGSISRGIGKIFFDLKNG